MIETSARIDKNQVGKGYYEDSGQVIEKSLFEQHEIQEIVSWFYIGNPSGICVEKGLKRLKCVPCDFKGVDPKPGDEKIFKTYHKTREMYLSEKMMMSLINKLERGR